MPKEIPSYNPDNERIKSEVQRLSEQFKAIENSTLKWAGRLLNPFYDNSFLADFAHEEEIKKINEKIKNGYTPDDAFSGEKGIYDGLKMKKLGNRETGRILREQAEIGYESLSVIIDGSFKEKKLLTKVYRKSNPFPEIDRHNPLRKLAHDHHFKDPLNLISHVGIDVAQDHKPYELKGLFAVAVGFTQAYVEGIDELKLKHHERKKQTTWNQILGHGLQVLRIGGLDGLADYFIMQNAMRLSRQDLPRNRSISSHR